MSREDLSFTSPVDGITVAVYRWPAAREPVAAVQIAHGLGEHALRYAPLAAFLNRAGFDVYANDHRGHGKTAGSPENYGDFGDAGWDAVVADAVELTRIIRSRIGVAPIILLGHSMGSFLAQQYLLDHNALVAAAALSGSAAPDLIAHLVDEVGEGGLESLNKPFEPARTEFDWLSRDPAEVDAYVADPRCGFSMSERSRQSAQAAWERMASAEELMRIRKDLPLYVMAGDADPVNHDLEYLRPLVERYRAAGLRDVTEKYYRDGRHEMFNEINRGEVMADLLAWLHRILPV